ncbi:LuxR C-terminal-related transcriptional regulator [Nafulsella turpanensis]|uniref:LuxR C-terminal-related transcriptional regulator n=1 Tax=Nafulsella turpanensis TaxID=1265690 RepID=UPI000366B334|nr:LuxR C-terminal-related transcriptional regulator [Nafulsella turpanensis]
MVLDIPMDKQFYQQEPPAHELLRKREIQTISFISRGVSTEKMDDRLNLSPHTVNAHRKKILKSSPVELIVKALQLRIIQLP